MYQLLDTSGLRSADVVWAATLTISVALVFNHFLSAKDKSGLLYPPGPKPRFLLGNIDCFPNLKNGETFDTLILDLSKKYGLTFSLKFPFLGVVIVTADPHLLKKIIVTNNLPKSFFYKEFAPCIGKQSIVSVNGKEWAGKRKAFNPGFTPAFLKDMVKTMADLLGNLVERLEKEAKLEQISNMLSCAQMYTSSVILTVAFGEKWDSAEVHHPARLYEDEVCRLYTEYLEDMAQHVPLWRLFGSRDATHTRKAFEIRCQWRFEGYLLPSSCSDGRQRRNIV